MRPLDAKDMAMQRMANMRASVLCDLTEIAAFGNTTELRDWACQGLRQLNFAVASAAGGYYDDDGHFVPATPEKP